MHEGHRERLKQQFKNDNYSIDKWQEHNILELLLFYSVPRVDTNETAHRLLNKFGSLAGILDASPDSLLSVDGVGSNSAVFLKLLPQIFSLYLDQKLKEDKSKNDMTDIDSRKSFFIPKFFGYSYEAVFIACLDNKNRVIACEKLFSGSVNSSNVSFRMIIEYAIRNSASGIIIAHNHPNGTALPSYQDVLLTKQLNDALFPVSIKLLDHIIVSENDASSLRELGQF